MCRIEKANLEDLDEILRLQYLAYQSEAALFGSNDIPPLKQKLDEVTEEYAQGRILKMIDEDGTIIGSVRAKEADGTVYIGKLMVHPDHRRKGYGRRLLTEIERNFPGKRYELFTSTRSKDNIRLYKDNGYREFDQRVVKYDLVFVYMEKRRLPEIRDAKIADARHLLEIYDYYVKNTAITFEYETPSLDEFTARMQNTMKRYPYLVIEKDGRIVGYAYAGVFKDRAAYDRSCETTIYIDRNERKNGLGRMLYEALAEKLKEMGILNLYACIGYPDDEDEYLTRNSAEFHEHLGYSKVGEFHRCGYKFGRWYNMIWMEKIIGEHHSDMDTVSAMMS